MTHSRQKQSLLELPLDILALIFEWALCPPWSAIDSERTSQEVSPSPRYPAHGDRFLLQEHVDTVTGFDGKKPKLRDKSISPALTLHRLSLTCKSVYQFVSNNKCMDACLWRKAVRSYFDLPSKLNDVQGSRHATSWRNVLLAFWNFQRPVESFAHDRTAVATLSWTSFKDLRTSSQIPKSQLKLLCLQPGPDDFHITKEIHATTYTLSLGLLGGNILVDIDEFGRFSCSNTNINSLKKSTRGRLPADLFEVGDDRNIVVQMTLVKPHDSGEECSESYHQIRHRWDLSCVQDFVDDELAKIAQCQHLKEFLVFTLFRSNENDDPLATIVDPEESNVIYCVKSELIKCSTAVSASSTFSWSRTFTHKLSNDLESNDLQGHNAQEGREGPAAEDSLDKDKACYQICNLQVSESYVVALLRCDTPDTSLQLNEDNNLHREFHVLSLLDGTTLRILQMPSLSWDFRHDDMCAEYNKKRLHKLQQLYNSHGAAQRATRVHDDVFILRENTMELGDSVGRDIIISGSHDYCIWVWDIKSQETSEPYLVLDDFYWKNSAHFSDSPVQSHRWDNKNERAGWWVNTPNQVLDFWHGFGASGDGRFFAACRAGRLFLWNLDNPQQLNVFTSHPETSLALPTESHDISATSCPAFSHPQCDLPLVPDVITPPCEHTHMPKVTSRAGRYLGIPRTAALGHQFRNWFEWKSRIPEQGLWMVFEDGTVVYVDREEILDACGVEGRNWRCTDDDFEPLVMEERCLM